MWRPQAAAAPWVAAEKGKANEMVEWLFGHQESSTPQSVDAQAKSMLGLTDFGKEYARLLPDIKRDAADGGACARFTPTYYVNGAGADRFGPVDRAAAFRVGDRLRAQEGRGNRKMTVRVAECGAECRPRSD